MKRPWIWSRLVLALVLSASYVNGAMFGTWHRYPCENLGFQMMVGSGWKVAPVSEGMVFVMQNAPDPYVRVAVGRMAVEKGGLDAVVAARLQEIGSRRFRAGTCLVDGQKAFAIEGDSPEGPFRDVFIEKGSYLYWIGFVAERSELWPQYAETFDLVVDGFRFI